MSHFDRFAKNAGETPSYTYDRKKGMARGSQSDLFGRIGILFAVVGWAVISLGVPLLAALGAGIVVMLVGSGICLLGLALSVLSSNLGLKVIALVLNGIGAIPAAFIVLAKILNYLFPV